MTYRIIDIHHYDAYFEDKERYIGQVGEVSEMDKPDSDFSYPGFVSCHFAPQDETLSEDHDGCMIFYAVKLEQVQS